MDNQQLYHIHTTKTDGSRRHYTIEAVPFSGINSVRDHYAWLLEHSWMLDIAKIEVVHA